MYIGKKHTHTYTHTPYLGDGDMFRGEFCKKLLAFAGGSVPYHDEVPVVDETADHAYVCVREREREKNEP